ncbi:hypothetical protein V1478_008211 [Vespula squamosa]|uniref:Uncharacterized protein n=1 Tax=Vespula squamosa TaxID=30214 RepID=A0ABD2AY37_VESSQ
MNYRNRHRRMGHRIRFNSADLRNIFPSVISFIRAMDRKNTRSTDPLVFLSSARAVLGIC